MAIATEISAALFTNIVASTPLNCNFPLYEADEVEVVYGTQALIAVYPTDYTVQLNEAEDFEDFTITPTAALLTKINDLIADPPTEETETNFVVVRRKLDYLTSVQPETVRYTPFLSKEIDRIHMKLIQLAEKVARTLGLPANVVGDIDTEYTISAPVEGKAPVWRGNKLVAEIDVANIEAARGYAEDARGYAEDAEAALAAALVVKGDTEDIYDDTVVVKGEAEGFAAALDIPALGAANTVLQVNAGGTANEYEKIKALNVDINAATDTVITASDEIWFADVTDSNLVKKDTVQGILDLFRMPVGSIYMNASDATNPATLLGYGTWTALGVDRVLIGVGSTYATPGETGGSDSQTLATTNLASHRHLHGVYSDTQANAAYKTGGSATRQSFSGPTTTAGAGSTDLVGSGTAFSIVQSYEVVYMWKRTA